MQNKPLVSVIVPVYNVEGFINKCIQSILDQTYENYEIILINDGSTDKSAILCDKWAALDRRIRTIHKINEGLSSARNVGLELAKGEWIQFVDSDDYIAPTMMERMLSACIKNDTLIAVCGRIDVDFDTGIESVSLCPQKCEVISSEECNGRLMMQNSSDFIVCDKFFHKSIWNDIRFPYGRHYEDSAIMCKLIASAQNISMLDTPFYYYVHRKNSITNAKFSEKAFHFPEHTAEILSWTIKNHPRIEKQARYLRVKAVSWILQMLLIEKKTIRNTYKTQYEFYHKELASSMRFWLFSNMLSMKQKLINVLVLFHLFGLVYKIKHF